MLLFFFFPLSFKSHFFFAELDSVDHFPLLHTRNCPTKTAHRGTPLCTTQPNNALSVNFRPSSDQENFVDKHRLSVRICGKSAKHVHETCTCSKLSFRFACHSWWLGTYGTHTHTTHPHARRGNGGGEEKGKKKRNILFANISQRFRRRQFFSTPLLVLLLLLKSCDKNNLPPFHRPGIGTQWNFFFFYLFLTHSGRITDPETGLVVAHAH